jgi:hypothetical protein
MIIYFFFHFWQGIIQVKITYTVQDCYLNFWLQTTRWFIFSFLIQCFIQAKCKKNIKKVSFRSLFTNEYVSAFEFVTFCIWNVDSNVDVAAVVVVNVVVLKSFMIFSWYSYRWSFCSNQFNYLQKVWFNHLQKNK